MLQWGQRHSALETKQSANMAVTVQALQWGQRHSALETKAVYHLSLCVTVLQWGQRHSALETSGDFDSGDGAHAASGDFDSGDGAHAASMGPTPFSVGDRGGRVGGAIPGVASMGPTPFSVGDRAGARRRCPHRGASMGPTPFSVGDAVGAAVLGAIVWRFNGANAIQRWRQGNSRWSWSADTRFNGANAIQRWRLDSALFDLGEIPKVLQWGQRHSALETRDAERCRFCRFRASMGPTPFSVGDEFFDDLPEALAVMLQWGQRHLALETGIILLPILSSSVIQWGPTPFSVGDHEEARRTE